MRSFVCFILFLIGFETFGQYSEDFSDSIWYSKNKWYGQINDFKSNTDKKLQSIGNASGQSNLFTEYKTFEELEWQFWIKLDFAPSESNQLKIYLYLDDTMLSKANGYYLQIGENGSLDAMKFYKLTTGKSVLLAEGTSAAVANDPTIARIKITKLKTNEWTVFADFNGAVNFGEELLIQDSSILLRPNGIFGIQCNYSSTRKDKFFFDDLSIKSYVPAGVPPKIKEVNADSNLVVLRFDKAIDSISANDPENYVFTGGLGQPWKAKLVNDSIVFLSLTKNNTPGTYQVLCKQITDRNGNTVFNLKATFTYTLNQKLKPYDVLITELMIDPTPTVRLPPYEYIEVYNNTSKDIDLSAFKLGFDKNEYSFDTFSLILPSYTYMILCEPAAFDSLKRFGNVIKMKRMPSLRNTDGTVLLKEQNTIIHSVSYSDAWYQDAKKKNGGYALEMINVNNVCDGESNWSGSMDARGGTPGSKNALANSEFTIPLRIDSLIVTTDFNKIHLFLNKKISTNPVIDISPSPGVQDIHYLDSLQKITISFNTLLRSGIVYTVELNSRDCIERKLNAVHTRFAKPETIVKNDLVLNEVLFNPPGGGSDYIEIFNASDKVLDIHKLRISNELNNRSVTITTNTLILPQTYWVFTNDTSWVIKSYVQVDTSKLITSSLPSLPDDKGNISIWSKEGLLIDSFTYKESLHTSLLNSKEGVALERNESGVPGNSGWLSATTVDKYGTPTRKNSKQIVSSTNMFHLRTKTFSPDADGNDDEMKIDYTMSDNTYQTQVIIFDDQGRRIKKLYNNVLLPSSGTITWDGTDDTNNMALNGIYIAFIKAFNSKGNLVNQKISVVLYRK